MYMIDKNGPPPQCFAASSATKYCACWEAKSKNYNIYIYKQTSAESFYPSADDEWALLGELANNLPP